MLIDVHMHVGKLYATDSKGLTPGYLLRFMDANGIAKACLLPMENPEHTDYYVLTEYVLQVCRKYPKRFIPFCNVDPRRRRVRDLLQEYRDKGCVGYGETISTLAMDDPLMEIVYEACGELNMPMHGAGNFHSRSCFDEPGLPRYEKMLRKFPKTIFIGHGPHFWANISADFDPFKAASYPQGRITAPGAVVRLLTTYPNAYADLSAGSGFNAIARDPEFGFQFLEQCRDSLLFGTDICHHGQNVPNAGYFSEAYAQGSISKTAYEKIGWQNAQGLLDI